MRQAFSRSSAAARTLVRRHRPDHQLVIYIGILLLIGLVVLYAISPARVEFLNAGEGVSLDQTHFMQRQLLYLFIGIGAFIAAATIPLSFWKRNAAKLLILSLVFCVLLLIFGIFSVPIALCSGGACRWFDVGFTTFQPAELVKFALLIYIAGFLSHKIKQGTLNSIHDTLIPLGILVGTAIIFIVGFQKDMGTGLALIGIVASMLYLAGINRQTGVLIAITTIAAMIMFILIAPHRLERVTTFLGKDGAESAKTSSYHITQAKIALGTGGVFGLGLGHNVQAFGYLPEAPNDSIFAVMGEAFGFVGAVCILLFILGLLLRLLVIFDRVENTTHRLIVAGVFGWIATHSVLNIGAMVGIIPLTGITLPLLSFGGTSLFFTMLSLGLVFHISRYTVHGKISDDDTHKKNSHGRRGIWRSRYANSRNY